MLDVINEQFQRKLKCGSVGVGALTFGGHFLYCVDRLGIVKKERKAFQVVVFTKSIVEDALVVVSIFGDGTSSS